MTEMTTINLFYPFLFLTIIVLIVTVCGTIKFLNGNGTHKGVIENIKDIFFKSSDNAKEVTIDTTSKMENMHDKVVDGIPIQYQREIHSIEQTVKQEQDRINKLIDDVSEINEKLNILLEWKFEAERNKK